MHAFYKIHANTLSNNQSVLQDTLSLSQYNHIDPRKLCITGNAIDHGMKNSFSNYQSTLKETLSLNRCHHINLRKLRIAGTQLIKAYKRSL